MDDFELPDDGKWTEDERDLWALRHRDSLTIAEIAERLQIPFSESAMRLARLQKKYRRIYGIALP